MKLRPEINEGILYIYIDNSLIKTFKFSFDEQNNFVGYFKYKGNRYDFILEHIGIMNRHYYKIYIYPINEFQNNQIFVKVKNP